MSTTFPGSLIWTPRPALSLGAETSWMPHDLPWFEFQPQGLGNHTEHVCMCVPNSERMEKSLQCNHSRVGCFLPLSLSLAQVYILWQLKNNNFTFVYVYVYIYILYIFIFIFILKYSHFSSDANFR